MLERLIEAARRRVTAEPHPDDTLHVDWVRKAATGVLEVQGWIASRDPVEEVWTVALGERVALSRAGASMVRPRPAPMNQVVDASRCRSAAPSDSARRT